MRLNHPKTDFFVGLLVILVMCTNIGLASEIHVYSGLSIQDAVDNASNGDLIIVHSGIYYENIKVDKELTILSESGNPGNTIIKPGNSNDSVFHINSDDVKICGFTIKDARMNNQSAVYLDNVSGNSFFNNNLSDNNYGIYLNESVENQIKNNYVTNNTDGIYLVKSNRNILNENFVSKNSNCGIHLFETENNTLLKNSVYGNHCGIKLEKSEKNKVIENAEFNNNVESTNNVEEIIPYEIINGGTVLNKSNNNILSENSVDYITINSSDNNTLNRNIVNEEVYLAYSNNNTLTENNAPIVLEHSNGNLLCKNTANSRDVGITILKSNNNIVKDNNISLNKVYGIHLKSSKNNVIFCNNLLNNFKGIYRDQGENEIYNNFIKDKYSLEIILIIIIVIILVVAVFIYGIKYIQDKQDSIKILLEKYFGPITTLGAIPILLGINELLSAYLVTMKEFNQLISPLVSPLVSPLSGIPVWSQTLLLPSIFISELINRTDPFKAAIIILLSIFFLKYIIECYYQLYKLDFSIKCCLKQLIIFSPFIFSWSTLFIVTYANIYVILLSTVIYTLTIILSNLFFVKFLSKSCRYKKESDKKSKKYIFLKAIFLAIWLLIFFESLFYALIMLLMWFIIYC